MTLNIFKDPQITRGTVIASQIPEHVPVTAMPADLCAEYERVAASLGFVPPGFLTEKLKAFLAESGLRVYPMSAVVDYLTAQYGPADGSYRGASWVWRPLRPADRVADRPPRDGYEVNGELAVDVRPYTKPIPLPVLLTVETILARFPGARFYVSDEYRADKLPDPFLAVVYGEPPEPLVIERWDEPNFRVRGGQWR